MSATIQDVYTPQRGLLGGIASSANLRTETAKSTIVTTRGKLVKLDTSGDIVPLSAITDTVAGVMIREDALQPEAIAIGDVVRFAKEGEIIVYCETAAVKGMDVHCRFIAGTGSIGDVRNSVDGVNTEVIKATFAESISSAGLVAIAINL